MSTGASDDIQGIVEIWAKDYFRRKANKKEQRLLDQELVSFDVDWKRVNFAHSPPEYDPEPPKPGTGKPLHNCLFHTTFTNKTDSAQTYNFSAERTTRSTCTVEIEQSYTKGYSMEVKLTTPGSIMEANAGFAREMTLTNISGETIEEELAWGVNSDIKVPGKHRAEAKMIITEEEYNGKFVVRTNVKGRVRVVFTNLKDNNSFIRSSEGDVDVIVQWAKDKGLLQSDAMKVDNSSRTVLCVTKGKCMFKYGLRQDVEVDHIAVT